MDRVFKEKYVPAIVLFALQPYIPNFRLNINEKTHNQMQFPQKHH